MRVSLILLPLLLTAVVVAQQADDADALVRKLGAEDFVVREDATKKLIEMGEKALPALKKAVFSEDLEVRLRASRALRAIQGEEPKSGDEETKLPAGSRGTSSSVGIQITNDGVKVRIQETIDGKKRVREYEGKSIEELQKKHPELKKHFRTSGDPFDMDKFWKDWRRDFDEDFVKRMREETKRDMERFERWLQMLQKSRLKNLERWSSKRGPMLGMRASRPDAVLDAQLELRGRGLVIDAVEKGTPADTLGLRRYDILVELNGKEIRRARDVADIMKNHKAGKKLTAKVVRAGKTITLSTER